MGLILLEALAALMAMLLIVWWTMFAGRRRGELALHDESEADGAPPASTASAAAASPAPAAPVPAGPRPDGTNAAPQASAAPSMPAPPRRR